MNKKKKYIRPEINIVKLDKSISLIMMTVTPPNPPPRPRGSGEKGTNPFSSPFSDKPFG